MSIEAGAVTAKRTAHLAGAVSRVEVIEHDEQIEITVGPGITSRH